MTSRRTLGRSPEQAPGSNVFKGLQNNRTPLFTRVITACEIIQTACACPLCRRETTRTRVHLPRDEMAEIIDLDEQKRKEQARRAVQERSRRMKAALQMFHCSRCAMKCMKCGSQLDVPSPPQQTPTVPYRFCQSCREEYEEFLERLHGRGDPRLYWYNQEWMEVWKSWMHYQDALSRFELSEGFRQLLKELNER